MKSLSKTNCKVAEVIWSCLSLINGSGSLEKWKRKRSRNLCRKRSARKWLPKKWMFNGKEYLWSFAAKSRPSCPNGLLDWTSYQTYKARTETTLWGRIKYPTTFFGFFGSLLPKTTAINRSCWNADHADCSLCRLSVIFFYLYLNFLVKFLL